MPLPSARSRTIAALAVLLLMLPGAAAAHDIPNDVMVQMFVKPQGERLRVLVRVPLRAMLDVRFPERGPGYLDLDQVDASLQHAATIWIAGPIEIRESGKRLAKPRIAQTRVSLESDRSFTFYDEALAHVTGAPLPHDTEVPSVQAMLDVLLDYPIESERSDFSVRPGFERLGLRVLTVLRFVPPEGSERAFEFLGDPGLVRLDPSWHQAALRFIESGFFHILDGPDHLLFLFCLVIPFRRFRELVLVVTSFTVAHSITLIASAYNLGPDALWFPPLIEMLIALSIVYMALENIVGGASVQRRWVITFAFGLVHGFGFSFLLRETLQFAGSHLLTSLLSFNVGVELGQVLVLAVLIPALGLLFRYVIAERMGTIILSALVAHTAWHWMTERWDALRQFPMQWPALNAALLARALLWVMLIVLLGGLLWFVSVVLRQRQERATEGKAAGMQ
jgi:HupE / UreJ protein